MSRFGEIQESDQVLATVLTLEPEDSETARYLTHRWFTRGPDCFFKESGRVIARGGNAFWIRYHRPLLSALTDGTRRSKDDIAYLATLTEGSALASCEMIASMDRPSLALFPTKRGLLAHCVDLARKIDSGDDLYAECGVWKGEAARWIASRCPGRLHVFDTFTGLPETWGETPAGSHTNHGKMPEFPGNVVVHVGLFAETPPRSRKRSEEMCASSTSTATFTRARSTCFPA